MKSLSAALLALLALAGQCVADINDYAGVYSGTFGTAEDGWCAVVVQDDGTLHGVVHDGVSGFYDTLDLANTSAGGHSLFVTDGGTIEDRGAGGQAATEVGTISEAGTLAATVDGYSISVSRIKGGAFAQMAGWYSSAEDTEGSISGAYAVFLPNGILCIMARGEEVFGTNGGGVVAMLMPGRKFTVENDGHTFSGAVSFPKVNLTVSEGAQELPIELSQAAPTPGTMGSAPFSDSGPHRGGWSYENGTWYQHYQGARGGIEINYSSAPWLIIKDRGWAYTNSENLTNMWLWFGAYGWNWANVDEWPITYSHGLGWIWADSSWPWAYSYDHNQWCWTDDATWPSVWFAKDGEWHTVGQ